jgi:hypothetical protein
MDVPSLVGSDVQKLPLFIPTATLLWAAPVQVCAHPPSPFVLRRLCVCERVGRPTNTVRFLPATLILTLAFTPRRSSSG